MAHTPITLDPDGVGHRITEAREAASLTVNQLAGLCDCPPATIRTYESGGSLPGAQLLARMALALEVTTDEILGLPRVRWSR